MTDNKKTPLWLDRHQILDPAHADWLETQAAISEFGNGMPREEAEAKAYADYKRKHSAQAAAHHLAGMRAASGEEAKQHGAMYALHCKHLGCDPSGPVPDEVKAFLNSDDFKHPVKFSAHKADSFVLDTPKPIEQMGKNELDPEYMVTLYRTAKLATILGELAKSVKLNKFDDYEDEEGDEPLADSAGLPSHEIDHSSYGWWIRPDGKVINIPGEETGVYHEDAAPEIQEWASSLPQYDNVDFSNYRADDFAHALGFVRAVRGHGFELHNPLTDQQRKTIAKLWPHFEGGNADVQAFDRDRWQGHSPIPVPIPMGSNPSRTIDHIHKVMSTGRRTGEHPVVKPWGWEQHGSTHVAWPTADSSGDAYTIYGESSSFNPTVSYWLRSGDKTVGESFSDLASAQKAAVSHYESTQPKKVKKAPKSGTIPKGKKVKKSESELNKGWPKDDKENRENLEANAAFSDMAEEQGVPAPGLQPRPGVDLRPALRYREQLRDILNDESSGEWQWNSTSPSYDPSSVYGVSPVMTKKLSRHGWNVRATGPAGEVVGGRYTPKDPRGTWRIHVKPDEDTPPNEEPPDLRDMIRPPFNIKAVSEHHVKAIADALQQHLDAGRPIREFDPSATKPPRTYHPSAYEKKFGFRRPLPKKSTIPTGLAKTLVPPVQAPAQPALHNTLEGFVGALKALPKGSPERLKLITRHMGHAPFQQALQAHPQGPAIRKQLLDHLNSTAAVGFRPGMKAVATAKNELAKGEVANNPGFFLDEEHQLPTHFETEGYRLHLSHNGADTHMATVHRGANVVGRVELVPGGFREEWNNPRHGLDSAVKMVLSAHANRQPVVDGWNNAMFSAGAPVAKMAKAAPGFTGKVQGAEVTSPHSTYSEASTAKPKNTPAHGNKNLWVRQSSEGSNANRTLMVQFSSDLLQGNRQRDHADDYYDKLYKNREGYHRPDDFWELPQWQAHLANSMPNADHYTIRDPKEAIAFANAAGYKNVAFSALDVNRDFVKEFAQGYKGNVVVGGYTDMSHFAGLPNVKVHNTIKDFVESEGGQYNPGYDYRHFSGAKTIPRLTLSDGCSHKCAFCCVPKQVTEKTRDEILQQVDSFSKHLPSDLIYLNDKTFGQAPNHAMLPEIYDRIKASNPNFKGFIVQTTAAQLKKMDPEFLKKAGIRHVEIGVESYNDSILKAHKKPANEQLIDESAQKLRSAGIGLIPNIMVGLPGENQNTYNRTMDWLNRNSDIVSHVNAYNLALYDESELGKKIGALSNADKDENQIAKSFHVDPQVHKDFSNRLFAYASGQLDKHPNVMVKAEKPKAKANAKVWKSKDGITIPHHGTPERNEWDKRFRQALIGNFAGGNAARLKPVKVEPELATTTNMPVNKARLELYKQMAKKDKLPPIIVRRAGRGFVVIDGNHRLAAAVDAKLPHVDGYELVMPK